ncbi:MAG: hypothetical protein DRG76_10415 [Deltaproteobacteria bacterium]|nr:MAG: hypothetical protein DRG76_10415 [Deltaproteobacteria bacterium]
MDLIQKLRLVRPEIAITSDVMVGFPGETRQDFEMTLDLIKLIEFDGLFSFKYSDRRGTLAARFEDKVPEQEKSERLQLLQAIQKDITIKKNKSLEGKEVEVLIEGPSARGKQLSGRTGTNKIVNFNCDSSMIGRLVNVYIKVAYASSLIGELREPLIESQ